MCSLFLRWHVLRAGGPEGLLWSAYSVGVRAPPYLCVWLGRGGFCGCPGVCCVGRFRYSWGRWCVCLSVGACSVGAWEQWRWRVLRAGSVGLLLRRRILVEGRTLLCGAYSGCGWTPLLLGVLSASGLRWIVPLCLILTAFFPPSPERAETLRRNLLFEGTMLMPSDRGLCYFMRGP